ncbi:MULTISPECIES: hypothetical protein [Nocardia]|uniref:DUF2946 family protein n=2 Tax=Nocardia TaxID=1817 RepID=A0A366CVH2_9NOCA|nr:MULTISPECIES: hypothetical protein [Nocardia]AVH20818.1 hypothetical protein C5B73_04345 [Nocardia cyriacigeorgica]MBF6188588.1 hypothetical protein [Nocardia farcinica]PPJ08120.1 hypothetical protein C5E43_16875 [Nocardia cyriacigeorgica]RBO80315.1 hypothetical protein DFR74_12632 [Nocardia puris]UGT55026.1 hypothetical protein LTT85_31310 [Nocardia asteroides]
MIFAPMTARRAALLRLAVALSAFVAIALVHGAQCQTGMPMTMAHSAAMVGGVAGQCGGAQVGDAGIHEHDHGPDSGVGVQAADTPLTVADDAVPAPPVGLVMACLAAFLAMLATLAFPRRDVVATVLRRAPDVAMIRVRAVLPRAPTLAELCVLRT